ncbi:uncharacterized protein V1516DRAFT_548873 [Lipomyces oligophaga]|uniref:uncharacterized protein n=1 Tax=Lipomyces oligophaga TaxID=45792 RepID=UPI0034CF6083
MASSASENAPKRKLEDIEIALYPPLAVRRNVSSDIWIPCLECWCSITNYFIEAASVPDAGLSPSLISFLKSYVSLKRDDDGLTTSPEVIIDEEYNEYSDPKSRLLRHNVFRLLYRQYMHSDSVKNLDMVWGFVRLYGQANQAAIQKLIKHLGFANSLESDLRMTNKLQAFILNRLASGSFNIPELQAVQVLLKDSEIAISWVTMSLWIPRLRDIVATAGSNSAQLVSPAEAALKLAFVSLVSLASASPQLAARLINELIQQLPSPTSVTASELIPALVIRTPMIKRLQSISTSHAEQSTSGGLSGLTIMLETIKLRLPPAVVHQASEIFRNTQNPNSRSFKEKVDRLAHVMAVDDISFADFKKIHEIQDLFPDESEERINELLRDMNGSSELVIAYLVENATQAVIQVPADQDSADEQMTRDMQTLIIDDQKDEDDDEQRRFDELDFAPGSIHFGKRDVNADGVLSLPKTDSEKQKIFDVLQLMYDEDDDERDDTYDDIDAAALIFDNPDAGYGDDSKSGSSTIEAPDDQNEKYLWSIYSLNEDSFTTKHRGTKAREDQKRQTGWSDEQIEGWAKMMTRDVSCPLSVDARLWLICAA